MDRTGVRASIFSFLTSERRGRKLKIEALTPFIEQARRLLEVTPAQLLLPAPPARPETLTRRLLPAGPDLCPVCRRGHMIRAELLPVPARSPPGALESRNWIS